MYIAATTLSAKPLLVWESESGYPRYYIPIDALHPDIKAQLGNTKDKIANGQPDGSQKASLSLEQIASVKGEGNDSEAVIERLTVNTRSMTHIRFTEGPLMGFIRFEREEIGKFDPSKTVHLS